MSKEKILKYLQENAFDLRKRFPSLVDAKFEAKPNRMVLVFDSTVPTKLENFIKVLDFKVEIVELAAAAPTQEVAGENTNVAAWKERHKGAGMNEPIPDKVEESVSPVAKNAQTTEAYEAWKKRHSCVKIR